MRMKMKMKGKGERGMEFREGEWDSEAKEGGGEYVSNKNEGVGKAGSKRVAVW